MTELSKNNAKEQIREIALSYGADLCGFAGAGKFGESPDGFRPADVYPRCKTVISFALALPRGLLEVSPRLTYGHYNDLSCREVDFITFKTAKRIEEVFNCYALPLPCDVPYEYWDAEKKEGRGLLPMKEAAVKAGLGTVGKNSLLITARYGNMVTLGAVLTDLEVPPDDEITESLCIENCDKCVKACPVKAINGGKVNQKLCRERAYGKTKRGFDTVECNMCRAVCPRNNYTGE